MAPFIISARMLDDGAVEVCLFDGDSRIERREHVASGEDPLVAAERACVSAIEYLRGRRDCKATEAHRITVVIVDGVEAEPGAN